MKALRSSNLVPRKKNPKVPAEFKPAASWRERLTGWKFSPTDKLCVSWGGGVDSTAMIIGLVLAGVKDLIITHAETGSEWPATCASKSSPKPVCRFHASRAARSALTTNRGK